MLTALVTGAIGLVNTFIDKNVEDKDEANRLKAQFASQAQDLAKTELEGRVKVIVAEANGTGLKANWRPITMLTFVAMVVAWWFGFTPERATPELMESIFDLIKIGLGGYVIGRSGEKIAGQYFASREK